jgi:hypothetical protein
MDVEESLLLSRASGIWTYICAAYCVLDRDKRLQRMASDRADQDSHDSPKSGESEADSKNVLFPVHQYYSGMLVKFSRIHGQMDERTRTRAALSKLPLVRWTVTAPRPS